MGCPTCGSDNPAKCWVRVGRTYQPSAAGGYIRAYFTDDEVGKWADIATEGYEHYRCPDPFHSTPDPVGEGEERLDFDSWIECTDCGWSLADMERDGDPIPSSDQYNEGSQCPRCGEPMERVVPFRKAEAILAASHQRIESLERALKDLTDERFGPNVNGVARSALAQHPDEAKGSDA